jgi:general L-amino acid transport system substrate-binding protein
MMRKVVIVAGMLAASTVAASAATLDTVKSRGTLICGVSAGFAGFSAPDSQGNYKGLDVDYCRALAAGVLGDASKVRYVSLTAQNRFTALQSGEIDVLYRNSTQTYLRGVTLGLRQGPVNFYDGQGFVVKKDLGVKEIKDLKGATVCVAQGTTHEVTLGDYGRANGIDWKPLVFDRVDTMYQTFFGGRCDAMTQDASALAGAVTTAAPNPADYVVLPQTISKEPLGPFTRNGDEVWSDIITWLHRCHARQCRRDGEVTDAGGPAPAGCLRRPRLAARSRQQMAGDGDQGHRQLRRDLRAQCRQGEPAQARPRPQRPLEQGRLDVRGAV